MTKSQITNLRRMLVSPLVLSTMLAMGSAPPSLAARECSNATLEGAYGFAAGSIILPNGTPRSAIVRWQFDGKGNFTNAITQNNDGNVIHATDAGTYTVNADCTGKIFTDGSTRTIEILVVNGGTEFYSVRTDPPTIIFLFNAAKKIFPGDGGQQ
jgi:hypothetical protein